MAPHPSVSVVIASGPMRLSSSRATDLLQCWGCPPESTEVGLKHSNIVMQQQSWLPGHQPGYIDCGQCFLQPQHPPSNALQQGAFTVTTTLR